jgi:hypothetical protein
MPWRKGHNDIPERTCPKNYQESMDVTLEGEENGIFTNSEV